MNEEPAQASASPDWRKILGWVALAFVGAEVVSAFFIEFPVAAIVFAGLFLIGWFLLRRGGLFGVLLVGVLFPGEGPPPTDAVVVPIDELAAELETYVRDLSVWLVGVLRASE